HCVIGDHVFMGGLAGAHQFTWIGAHAIIGGFAGAAVAKAGFGALLWGRKWIETLSAIVVSPMLGMAIGFVLMVLVYNVFRRASPRRIDKLFRPGQLLSSALLSVAHGTNDAQKTIGVIVALLVASKGRFAAQTGLMSNLYVESMDTIPVWVKVGAFTCISLGTLFGGWRIVHTMGSRITKLRPVNGFCAETGAALVILSASSLGIPVSTTHTITGTIVGVGATNRLSAVRWGVARRIVWAWVLTIPASAIISSVVYLLLARLIAE
ncbi:MAG: inorganic phosphate transporter, partial [Gemmatimonadaceae bacterium]